MYTTAYIKVEGGYLHNGNGHRRDSNGNYPVYPLPRWSIFENYRRHKFGTSYDIMHYMQFFIDNYQTLYNCDITGDEIANIMTRMYSTSSAEELRSLNVPHNNWSQIFESLKTASQRRMHNAVFVD